MPIKQGKSNKITLGLVTGIGLKLAKNGYKTGERTPKGHMVPFSRSHMYILPSTLYPKTSAKCRTMCPKPPFESPHLDFPEQLADRGLARQGRFQRVVLADVPLYRNLILKHVFSCSATLAEVYDFRYSGTPKPERGTFAKAALLQDRPFVSSRSELASAN